MGVLGGEYVGESVRGIERESGVVCEVVLKRDKMRGVNVVIKPFVSEGLNSLGRMRYAKLSRKRLSGRGFCLVNRSPFTRLLLLGTIYILQFRSGLPH